jgi:hypothetical protein
MMIIMSQVGYFITIDVRSIVITRVVIQRLCVGGGGVLGPNANGDM